MMECKSVSKDKLINLEDGLISNVESSYVKRKVGTTISCKHLIECIKFLLYFELLLFVGWASYTILETYGQVESLQEKITDGTRNSESHNSHPQQLPYEETTTISGEFLVKMENLFQTENTLTKTLEKQFKKQLHSDETDMNFVKTTEEPHSETVGEDSINTEHSLIFETGVPKFIEVEMEKDLETNESEDTDFDLSKSEDTNSDSSKSSEAVLVWNFGFLPFPSIYNIKVQPQSSTIDSDKSESTEIEEKLLEMDNHRAENDDINDKFSASLNQMIEEFSRQMQRKNSSKKNTDPKFQDSSLNEQFSEMNGDDTLLTTPSQINFESEGRPDDSVYDDEITAGLRPFIEKSSEQNFESYMPSWIPEMDEVYEDDVYDSLVFLETDFTWSGKISTPW